MKWRFSLLITGLLLVIWIGLFAWSSIPITPKDALTALIAPSQDQLGQQVVLQLKLPRVLVAGACGMALALAGVLIQTITQNPLASPGILGINAGASLGLALVSSFPAWMGVLDGTFAAILGGAATWCLVMLVGQGWKPQTVPTRLILTGVAVSALSAALTRAAVVLEEEQTAAIMSWMAGTFANARWDTAHWYLPVALITSAAALTLSAKLNLLHLGHDQAKTLGLHLTQLRVIASVLILVLVAASVAAVGSIGFIGLIVPHMARAIVGHDHRFYMPFAALGGAVLVIGADIVSRALNFPLETPAGAVVALLGAPFFLYLIKAKRV